ncbi:hypothetical protein M426DRAFT_76323 [Hypoxylon sp. CI-4A]|nr:hypothetical protein M426DRAFT_76323 [Hypoxylon sp. CI-4A]
MIELEHSPGGGAAPLQEVSADRVNQQRDASLFSPTHTEHPRDSDVHDKIRQFNNMAYPGATNGATMSRQLERKTADAALKRAMLGREEAEGEMRRYRDEARALRRQVEESRGRERKVGERLEDVMEKYGQAKETLQHSKAIWEKEIRQARKEVFKVQSTTVKLQEELKAARNATKAIEESLAREKELGKAREQEAFQSRYQLAEIQEQLEKALERITFVEQEREAYKEAAKTEEIARIAAEGRLPLPPEEPDSEFASPKKGRVSLSTTDIVSSAASEAEIEELTRLWQWEKQRADRTQEHLDFAQAECELRFCAGAKSRPRKSARFSGRQVRPASISILDPADQMFLGPKRESKRESLRRSIRGSSEKPAPAEPRQESPQEQPLERESSKQPSPQPEAMESPVETTTPKEEPKPRVSREIRRSTIFVPSEGIFRTISQEDLRAMDKSDESTSEPPTPVDVQPNPPYYSRTPSVEPPTFALLAQERTSLLSLLNAPHDDNSQCAIMNIPTASQNPSNYLRPEEEDDEDETTHSDAEGESRVGRESTVRPQADVHDSRPHTTASFYTVTTTTTVPVRDNRKNGEIRNPSFDATNPAMTPTMTREQALAQIRERRGRARSAAQGLATPRRQMVTGTGNNRDTSAPAVRAAKGRSA